MKIAALLATACLALPALADTVTVFAAASLKEALDANARAFEAASGHRVVVSYAGSNALAKQIEKGAPAALFIAADADWVEYVEKKGLVLDGTRRNLLANDLVLVAPTGSATAIRLEPGVDIAARLGGKRIALANPDVVPAGKYAKAAFRTLGAWDALAGKVAATDNVRAALALVARAEAPLGVVYRTDALAERKVRIVDVFPGGSHPPVLYRMVTLKKAGPAAIAFAAFLEGPAARATFEKHGFRTAPR